MEQILDNLKYNQNRDSTKKNYLTIWHLFNKFLLKLDDKCPRTWEHCVSLYCAHLVDSGIQSSTLQSYVSAIRHVLVNDNYKWNDNKILLTVISKACKLKNDVVKSRLPIQFNLFEALLFEIDRHFRYKQPYLNALYKALFALGYYGLMRIGKLTLSDHTLKAQNVHIGINKNKIQLILYSSKTHGKESLPQKIKISQNESSGNKEKFFCPFKLTRQFINFRGNFDDLNEQFFVFADKSPVKPCHVLDTLTKMLKNINMNHLFYTFHSLQIGHGSDLIKFGYSIEQIKRMGHWKSNAVYKYLRS